jgi:inosine-uridine nucleoside N-ribohydrolase
MGHGCYGHDVLAFVWLVAPELFKTQNGRVRVATEGIANGQTMMAKLAIPYPQAGWEADKPETRVCMEVDAAACEKLIDVTLASDWLLPALIK